MGKYMDISFDRYCVKLDIRMSNIICRECVDVYLEKRMWRKYGFGQYKQRSLWLRLDSRKFANQEVNMDSLDVFSFRFPFSTPDFLLTFLKETSWEMLVGP